MSLLKFIVTFIALHTKIQEGYLIYTACFFLNRKRDWREKVFFILGLWGCHCLQWYPGTQLSSMWCTFAIPHEAPKIQQSSEHHWFVIHRVITQCLMDQLSIISKLIMYKCRNPEKFWNHIKQVLVKFFVKITGK